MRATGTDCAANDATCSILVVDDIDEIRLLLRALLAELTDCPIVAEARSGTEAIELAALHQPTLCILDVEMPGMSGLDALPEILRRSPATKVVVFSSHPDKKQNAYDLGAAEYVEKGTSADTLVRVVRGVLGEAP